MSELEHRTEVDQPAMHEPTASGVQRSRAVAVSRISCGVLVSALGAELFVAGFGDVAGFFPFLGWAGALCSAVGLSMIGLATPHMVKYGNLRPALFLSGTAGLGLSAAAFTIFAFVGWSAFPALLCFLGFAAFLALLMIGSLVQLMAAATEDSRSGSSGSESCPV